MAPTIELAVREAHALTLLDHAARLAGLAEEVQRRNGRQFVTPLTWLQAAKADLQDLGVLGARELRLALPLAAAAFDADLLDTAMRTATACGMFAKAAEQGVAGLAPRVVKRRVVEYPEVVKQTRRTPAARRRPPGSFREVELESRNMPVDGDALAAAEAGNDRNHASAQRMHRDAKTVVPVAVGPFDDEVDPRSARQLQMILDQTVEKYAPPLEVEGLELLGIEEPLPTDQRWPTAILIAIDLVRDPHVAHIVRSTDHRSDELKPGRALTGHDSMLLQEWVDAGRRVYLARAGHEYEAHAACTAHPWGRTQQTTTTLDPRTGRVISTLHGGDDDYTWAERYFRLSTGAYPSPAALKIWQATNACPICNLPHGARVTTDSRLQVDAYRREAVRARTAYQKAKGSWPSRAATHQLFVTREGRTERLGTCPEPVLDGCLYEITRDLQAEYVARCESFYSYRFGDTKVPQNPDQMRAKWRWLAEKFGPRPVDRFTVAQQPTDTERSRDIYCVGEPEREAEQAEAQAELDAQYMRREG